MPPSSRPTSESSSPPFKVTCKSRPQQRDSASASTPSISRSTSSSTSSGPADQCWSGGQHLCLASCTWLDCCQLLRYESAISGQGRKSTAARGGSLLFRSRSSDHWHDCCRVRDFGWGVGRKTHRGMLLHYMCARIVGSDCTSGNTPLWRLSRPQVCALLRCQRCAS